MPGSTPFTGRLSARLLPVLVTIGGALVLAGPAEATWSIVGVDSQTGEVGAAIASCVPGEVLGEPAEPLVPVVLVPGVAAAVTQGQLNIAAPARINELVDAGAEPAAIIADLIGDDFDELASLRQHAVARLPSSVAAHTGGESSPEALDRQGEGVSVQGNLLAATTVVTDSLSTFGRVRENGGDLAEALVEALLAGSAAGGDRRCGDQTALFAQVVVARPGDDRARPSTLITVTVDENDGQNPVQLLADAYRSGRRGAIDAGRSTDATGPWFRIAVFAVVGVMVAAGGLALARGMGSIRARR